MSDKEDPERRVYNLPAELVARIRAFQSDQSIASETEAVRRLLDFALAMRDSVDNLLDKLELRFAHEKDFRVIARDILTPHPLVKSVHFGDKDLSFSYGSDEYGKIEASGDTFTGSGLDSWYRRVKPAPRQRVTTKSAGTGWEKPKAGGSDLDDDIPF